jgi:hypothetical protein
MTTLLKKYSILVIASMVTSYLLAALILYISPHLLTTQTPDGVTHSFSSAYLKVGIDYLINIIFVFLLYKEMKKMKFMNIPILTLTFFDSIIGIIFLFIIIAYENFTTKQLIK